MLIPIGFISTLPKFPFLQKPHVLSSQKQGIFVPNILNSQSKNGYFSKTPVSAQPAPAERSHHYFCISKCPNIYRFLLYTGNNIHHIYIYIFIYIYRYSHADTQTPSAKEPAPPKPAGRLPFLPLKTPFSPCTKLFFLGGKSPFFSFFPP